MANHVQQRPIVIFDVVAKTLSATYLAELQVTKGVTYEQAVEMAHVSLETAVLSLGKTLDGFDPASVVGAQLLGLKLDMDEYLRTVNLFKTIRSVDYRTLIKPGDPSLFATTGSAEGVRRWGLNYAREQGVNEKHLTALLTVVVYALKSMKAGQFDATQPVPDIQSSVPGVPSLEWVIDYRFRHGISYEEAHILGVTLLDDDVEGVDGVDGIDGGVLTA